MKKKLYRVTETYYVLAEDEVDAQYVSVNHSNVDKDVERVDDVREINHAWLDLLPFCDNPTDDCTCRQIMEEIGE